MLRLFSLLWANPTLRLMATVSILHGVVAASIGIYQSVLAVTVFGLSDSWLSLMLLIALVLSVGASIGVGIITDQRPSRKLMALVAVVALFLGAALVWLLPSRWTFVIAHMFLLPLNGTIFGQFFAVTRLASNHLPRADRDGIMALVRAGFALPFVVILPLWGVAFSRGVPLVTVYPALVLLAVVMFALIRRYWPADSVAPWVEVKSGLGFRASFGELLDRRVLLSVAIMGTIHVGSNLNGITAGLLFAQSPNRDVSDVALFFGLFIAIEVVVTVLIGQILRFFSTLQVIVAGAVIFSLYMLLIPIVVNTPWVWSLAIVVGIGGALIYALAIGYMQDQLGNRAGAGASLLALQRLVSDGLATGIFAFGTALSGYGLVYTIGSGVLFAGTVALVMVERRRASSAA